MRPQYACPHAHARPHPQHTPAPQNAERFYHSPGTLGSRRWSALAKWRLRELNELPHYVSHRLAAGHEAAARYLAQFPSPFVTQVGGGKGAANIRLWKTLDSAAKGGGQVFEQPVIYMPQTAAAALAFMCTPFGWHLRRPRTP